jgi:RNA polymerase II subunit A-like phosphatase
MSTWEKEDEEPYLVEIHKEDRKLEGESSSVSSSIHDSDEESEEEIDSEDDDDSIPNSQEEEQKDDEGVMPHELEGGTSPIDDLKKFDWGGADEELKEFMGEDDTDDDSDTGSVASDLSLPSRGSNRRTRDRKRKHDETTDEDDSDEESTLAKKQRVANSRTTGLKTVKTPNSAQSESSLPTPLPTADENDEGSEVDPVDQISTNNAAPSFDDDDDDDDLEAEMLAAFAEQENAAAADTDGGG